MSINILKPYKETSYPLLWIARAFRVDYGDVLSYADWWEFFNWYNCCSTFDVLAAENDPHFVFDYWKMKAKANLPLACKKCIVGYCKTGRIVIDDATWNSEAVD